MNNIQAEFGKIYDDFVEKIYRFIFIKVNSQEIAEDLTSEVFLRCWQVYKRDQSQIEKIQPFLYQIAKNLLTDHYRKKARTDCVSLESIMALDPNSDIEEKLSRNMECEKIRAVLANLNNRDYQDVLIWHYVNDLSIPEISQMIGKNEKNVRVLLHRALKTLKNKVEEG